MSTPARQASYDVHHVTTYEYTAPVSLSQQLLHLAPRTLPYQLCLAHALTVEPAAAEYVERVDFFGNRIVQFAVRAAHQALVVEARSAVHLGARWADAGFDESPAWEDVRARLRDVTQPPLIDAVQYLFDSPNVTLSPALAKYARGSFGEGRPLVESCADLMARIHADFAFDPTATTVATPVLEVLARKRGVCQDFAHLMIACLRSLGLAARYVSGYLLTNPPPGQPRLVGADASHAWVSVFCPHYGWVDFDPTNDVLPELDHITVAWGRDFSDVTPMRGVILGGGMHEVEVEVTVSPLDEAPPASLPAAAAPDATPPAAPAPDER